MPTITDKEERDAKNILALFAQYSFRKTSMEEIAKAVGVSRQSIYKRFGSKEQCYQWTLDTYLAGMYQRIFTALDNKAQPPIPILLNVFDIFIGQAIDIVRNPHGTDVFRDALRTTHASQEDWPLRYRARLADFLEHHHLASGQKAMGMAFCLISAGKGLLMEETSREQFLDDMQSIIESLVS